MKRILNIYRQAMATEAQKAYIQRLNAALELQARGLRLPAPTTVAEGEALDMWLRALRAGTGAIIEIRLVYED